MITEISKEELIQIGFRYPGSGLVEQGGYTTAIATTDSAGLAPLLPQGYLTEVKGLVDDVRERSKDREVAEQESKFATEMQDKSLRAAKLWMRRVVRRSKRALHLGKQVPDTLLTMPSNTRLRLFCETMDNMVRDLEKYSANIPGADNAALMAEGKKAVNTLLAADFDQEAKRLNNLPAKFREYCYKKGLLYKGIKVINEAGHELHVDEPALAEKYSMKILYREGGKEKPEAAETPAGGAGAGNK